MKGVSKRKHGDEPGTIADLAQRIRLQFIKANVEQLPDTATLSGAMGVSRMKLLSALHQLRAEKLISFRRGSRIVVRGRKALPQGDPSLETAERIFRLLKEKIRTGQYRAGQQLPKRDVLAIENRTSSRAITEACKRLLAVKLVHRAGKRIVIGPAPAEPAMVPRHPKYIVVVEERSDFWPNICRSHRTSAFGRVFIEEAGRAYTRVRLCTMQQRPGTSYFGYQVESLPQILQERGESILGFLFAFQANRLSTVSDFIYQLKRENRRAAWLDSGDEGLPAVLTKANLIRCHFSERPAMDEAVKFLHRQGHHEALYITHGATEWTVKRLRMLKDAAESVDPPLTIRESMVLYNNHWQGPGLPDTVEKLGYLYKHGPDRVRFALRYLMEKRDPILGIFGRDPPLGEPTPFDGLIAFSKLATPEHQATYKEIWNPSQMVWSALSCFVLLTTPSITAVIASNDSAARSTIMPDLRRIGFKIPQDISVISFDNAFETSFLPLTTTDFGFGELGYQAYHAIAGDLPVKKVRNEIAARPFVVDRESVLPIKPHVAPIIQRRTPNPRSGRKFPAR